MACELVLDDEQKQVGIEHLLKEAKSFSAKLKKEMKTEEAHRALSQAQWMKKLSQRGELNEDAMLQIMMEQKSAV